MRKCVPLRMSIERFDLLFSSYIHPAPSSPKEIDNYHTCLSTASHIRFRDAGTEASIMGLLGIGSHSRNRSMNAHRSVKVEEYEDSTNHHSHGKLEYRSLGYLDS